MRGHRSSRILVAGKDARTDAIAAALAASPLTAELYALSELQNPPGLCSACKELRLGSLTDLDWLESATREIAPDLVVVGPEEPLAAGYVDRLDEMGIAAFGPSSELAEIESSKTWARELLEKYDIAGNPDHRAFASAESLREYMEELGDFVVKPDGLTAGKGVKVFGEHLHSIDEALAYALDVLQTHPRVLIEERLEGEEFSLQTITDGAAVIHCPLVQDHKRAFEGDQGPNTGGMGPTHARTSPCRSSATPMCPAPRSPKRWSRPWLLRPAGPTRVFSTAASSQLLTAFAIDTTLVSVIPRR